MKFAKGREERDKAIHRDFMTGFFTLVQLGKKYDLDPSYISRIISKFLKRIVDED